MKEKRKKVIYFRMNGLVILIVVKQFSPKKKACCSPDKVYLLCSTLSLFIHFVGRVIHMYALTNSIV